MEDKDIIEQIETVLSDMKSFLENGNILIVEGHKDKAALKALGVTANDKEGSDENIRLCANVPAGPFCEAIAEEVRKDPEKKIAILTDWDRRGKIRADSLTSQFDDLDIPYDMQFRRDLIRAAGRFIKDVESLDTFLRHLKEREEGPSVSDVRFFRADRPEIYSREAFPKP